ncbi:hypothetical protein VXP03_05300 [Acinetobacter baumannii]|uniref:hypothetical protein n=1 Tax=Acinetobacter baumannii TaxID=470 RepID=UPI003A895065
MDNYKKLEYLEPQNDGTFKHIESGFPTNGNPLVEIPEGAEIAFYFGAEYNHIVFYKKVGKTVFVMSPNYLDWNETTCKEIDEVPYNYANGFIVWERNKQVEKDPALISGAEALRALADGKEVEFKHDSQGWVTCLGLNIERVLGGWHQMRLKPQTIKVELELPKPFKPRDGDDCFIVDSEQEDGFYRFTYSEDSGFHQNFIQFGVYKTEDDVKKAVEQLRKIRGTNS